MSKQKPLFADFTWGAGGSTSEITLELATLCQNQYGMVANMHLTCTNMPADKVREALDGCKAVGIRNIVALRGDPPKGQEQWAVTEGGFACALDLVRYIRANYGDYFCIAVAGYPECHPETRDSDGALPAGVWESELQYLKEKVDAGADLIITQMFYDVANFAKWVADCLALGITVPILPGIMPIQSYAGWKRMTGFCKTIVPAELSSGADRVQGDEIAVKRYGIQSGSEFCKALLATGVVGLHFYTLNQEPVTYGMMQSLNFYTSCPECDVHLLPKEEAASKTDAVIVEEQVAVAAPTVKA